MVRIKITVGPPIIQTDKTLMFYWWKTCEKPSFSCRFVHKQASALINELSDLTESATLRVQPIRTKTKPSIFACGSGNNYSLPLIAGDSLFSWSMDLRGPLRHIIRLWILAFFRSYVACEDLGVVENYSYKAVLVDHDSTVPLMTVWRFQWNDSVIVTNTWIQIVRF